MGNNPSSHPNPSRRDPTNSAALSSPPTRSRPLKTKKRSIVDHPPLLAAIPAPAIPSTPIPIPIPINTAAHSPHPPDTPPDPDIVPELINHHRRTDSSQNHPRPPIQYNSTRSFGAVRRGGPQGVGGWGDPANHQPQQQPDPIPAPPPLQDPVEANIVRSSIPLRLSQAERARGLPEEPNSEEDDPSVGQIPTTIAWRGGGHDVFVAGTFHELEWRARERLRLDPTTNTHTISLSLPAGTYRIKFIVDDAWLCSRDLPTATDDDTGNLVNYIDVEDFSAIDLSPNDEQQGRDTRIMKANRKRIYPPRQSRAAQRSPTTATTTPNPGRAWHPPLLPPSDSFWGADSVDDRGWEHGRDGVLEKWTNVIPEPLIAAATQEEAYLQALQAAREVRRGGAGTRGTVGALGMGVPSIPPAPRLPRHLDKVILNTKPNGANGAAGSSSSRSGRSSRHRGGSRNSGLGMTSMLSPAENGSGNLTPNEPGGGMAGIGAGIGGISGSMAAMEQWAQADDSSVLPVPSHVVLHHLGTSAIRNGVIAVSDTTSTSQRYITSLVNLSPPFYPPALATIRMCASKARTRTRTRVQTLGFDFASNHHHDVYSRPPP
ncbi:carbohydrate-binding module family 48 protein [Sphaerobolus stellatus SS14]|nr:carbohydrate-binding module family 48 protein [Sphaerobolus stellatus SS14]